MCLSILCFRILTKTVKLHLKYDLFSYDGWLPISIVFFYLCSLKYNFLRLTHSQTQSQTHALIFPHVRSPINTCTFIRSHSRTHTCALAHSHTKPHVRVTRTYSRTNTRKRTQCQNFWLNFKSCVSLFRKSSINERKNMNRTIESKNYWWIRETNTDVFIRSQNIKNDQLIVGVLIIHTFPTKH